MANSVVRGQPLQTERLPSGRRKLTRALAVEVDGRCITVPKGFETDYSSIPWLFRFVCRWSKVDIAGVVHDYLYNRAQGAVCRRCADRIWRQIAGSGTRRAKAYQKWPMWLALAVACGPVYSKKAKKLPPIARGVGTLTWKCHQRS